MKNISRSLMLAAIGTLLTAIGALAQNAPVASDQLQVTPEDTTTTITLLATDLDGDLLHYTVVTEPVHGILSGFPPDLTYQPAAEYSGPDSFTFKADDGSADSNTSTVRISVTPVNDAPTGTVKINFGKERVTRSTSVLLTLTAADDGVGPIRVCISNTATCRTWSKLASLASTKRWKLASGSGLKTVNVWYRDQLGKTSAAPFSDKILLDTTAPKNGKVTAVLGDTKLTLNWSDFVDNDPGSGVTGYRVVFKQGSSAPSCSAGTRVPGSDSPATTLEHTGLVNGTTYAYRVCAIDAVGNISSGATVTGKPRLTNCVECHSGNPLYPLAPNVMKYWDGSWWDTTMGGSPTKQQGGHGDPANKPALLCQDCHDITLPPGTHMDGTYNSIWGDDSGTRNQNTSHLKASFIGGTTPASSVQVTLDAACWDCHQTVGGIVDMRHERDRDPAPDVAVFGTHLTRNNGDALPLPHPNEYSWPGPYPVDQDISTNASGSTYFVPCVSCHDPHGTGIPATPPLPNKSNFMLRDRYTNPSTLCRVCHT